MSRYLQYLQYNLTHEQIALVIDNYFKFDTATGKLARQREQFCFCMHTYRLHLENLSYQMHAIKLLRQPVTASKEQYLSNAKPCDVKIALDFSAW